MNFGRSRAPRYGEENRVDATFDDVPGAVHTSDEVEEIVHFVENPALQPHRGHSAERPGVHPCDESRLAWKNDPRVETNRTTVAVQSYLDELRDHPELTGAPQVVRELVGRSAMRLHLLCSSMIRRSYPRLARPPLNLNAEELLGPVVERLIKAMQKARPASVREFFGLANQHMRWELNEIARHLDDHTPPVGIEQHPVADRSASEPGLNVNAQRMLAALDSLGEDEREVFGLVRIQGLTHDEASEVLGVSTKTVQRRLNRGRVQLVGLLKDLEPPSEAPGSDLARI